MRLRIDEETVYTLDELEADDAAELAPPEDPVLQAEVRVTPRGAPRVLPLPHVLGGVVALLACLALARGHAPAAAPPAELAGAVPDAGPPPSEEALRLLAGEPMDLNAATAADLTLLSGVGPTLAARIVEERTRAGAFRRVEDLRAVRGIGPRTLDRLRPQLRVAVDRDPEEPDEVAD
jgi:competence protein ComEA